MDLTQITPLVLTYNEAPNIDRVLRALAWAPRIVVMDSGSTDETLGILAAHPTVDVVHRPFDTFAGQCNAGLGHVQTEWALSLDADYVLSDAFRPELERLEAPPDVAGYRARFVYCVGGQALRGSLYPPRAILYRRASAAYTDDGHGHRVHIDGAVRDLDAVVYHDDRKPRARWLSNQAGYAVQEVDKLLAADAADLSRVDRLRRWGLGPVLAPFYCLFWKRLLLDGKAGLTYTYERTYGETLIALGLLDRRLRDSSDHG